MQVLITRQLNISQHENTPSLLWTRFLDPVFKSHLSIGNADVRGEKTEETPALFSVLNPNPLKIRVNQSK